MTASPGATSPASRPALVAAFATIYIVWGSTYLANSIGIETIPPFLMAGTRFFIAGILLGAWAVARGAPLPTRQQWRDNTIVGLLLLVGGTGMVVWSQQYIPSGLTALIIGASPMFFVLTEWAWPGGAAPRLSTWAALVLGLAGIVWLVAPWQSVSAGGLRLMPALVILTSSFSWAIGSVYSRHTKDRAHSLVGASAQMAIGGGALVLLSIARGDWALFDVAQVSFSSAMAFLYLVIVGSLVAYPTFIWLTQHAPPARVATYAYVNPVVAVALGWLIRDEPVGPRVLVAAAIILTAVAIINARRAET